VTDQAPPIVWQYDGDNLVPASGYWRRTAEKYLTVGERYRMVEEADRSTASHNHEFAWLKEAWLSLPDDKLEQFPSPEHLRKYALIKKGHCTMKQYPCASEAEAERLRAALKDEADEYALIMRRRAVVTVYKAASQSKRAMGPAQFQQSKSDIIDYVAELLGVDPETLSKVEKAA
jgi:redox-sensitive bicupin YhaK (pirin superfamily)